jgi:hypothetical protein
MYKQTNIRQEPEIIILTIIIQSMPSTFHKTHTHLDREMSENIQ